MRTLCYDGASKFIGKGQLLRLKLKAVRAGVWFRALPRIDRVLVDLTIKVAQSIRSPFLASSILLVARKLEGLLESKFARAIREVACKLSMLAKEWGNRNAWAWTGDEAFARYLAVMNLNG